MGLLSGGSPLKSTTQTKTRSLQWQDPYKHNTGMGSTTPRRSPGSCRKVLENRQNSPDRLKQEPDKALTCTEPLDSLELAKHDPDRALICLDLSDTGRWATDRALPQTDPHSTEVDLIQIFIKTLEGRHLCWRIWKGRRILDLKYKIQNHLDISACKQNLIFSGLSLQDSHSLQDYGIATDSTIVINLRLRGGCFGTNSKSTSSFKDAIKGKEKHKPNQHHYPSYQGPTL